MHRVTNHGGDNHVETDLELSQEEVKLLERVFSALDAASIKAGGDKYDATISLEFLHP